jgi:two-component system, OmpR family, alkaline phosphatase synthesis response regulator PhoP
LKESAAHQETKGSILVVDDDPQMVGVVSYALQVAGYDLVAAYNAYQALDQLKNSRIDLIVLDVMLPGLDGFDLCSQLRKDSTVPVLFLSARADQKDVIRGLELGADDYMTKPFSTRELVLRVDNIFKRASHTAKTMQVDGLNIDFHAHVVTLNHQALSLSPLEYQLLAYLMRHAGRSLSIDELIQQVWRIEPWEGGAEMVKTEIYRLRQKLEVNPKEPRFIKTLRGTGYRFEKNV